MSTLSRRVAAAAAAAIVAVLTGIAVGTISPRTTCREVAGPAPSAPPTSPAAGLGGAETPPQQATRPAEPARRTVCTDEVALLPAGLALGGALVSGAVVLIMLMGGARREAGATTGRAAHRATAAGTPPATTALSSTTARSATAARPDGGDSHAEADRATLIQACIYVRDRTTSTALANRLGAALRDAGVRTLEPAGDRFDPARHEAGGATPSGDATKVGTIAAVEVPGYTDRGGRLLRAPVVTVYQAETGGSEQR